MFFEKQTPCSRSFIKPSPQPSPAKKNGVLPTLMSRERGPTVAPDESSVLNENVKDYDVGFIRKYLSADGLLKVVKHGLRREKFKVLKNSDYSWEDCIMSGLAIFGFKLPSLLQFEKSKSTEPFIRRNLRTLYGVENAPSDTCLRERLDEVLPTQLRHGFKQIFAYLQI